MLDLTALKAAAANQTTVDASIKSLLSNVVTQLKNLPGNGDGTVNQSDIDAITKTIEDNNADIAAAVVANTSADPNAGNGGSGDQSGTGTGTGDQSGNGGAANGAAGQ